MMTKENAGQITLYAGLYLRTQRRMRFWGWSSRGWGKVRAFEAEGPWAALADWLRQMHARLDRSPVSLPAVSETGIAPAPAALLPKVEPKQPRRRRKLQFVCNRRLIGLVIVDGENGEM